MKMEFKNTQKKVFFIILFFVLVLLANKVNFSTVVGADKQYFTLFQFFGPIAGAFLGTLYGVLTVFFSQLADFFIVGKEWNYLNLLRLLPMLFAAYYFGSRKRAWSVAVPLVCTGLFLLHPLGREAGIYTLFWLIPVLGKLLPEKLPGKLFFRSFGATFTAHAIGSVIWVYTVPMTASQWITLIPVTAYERFLFGMGIAGSYVLMTTVLDYLVEKWKLEIPFSVLFLEKKYSLVKKLH